MGDCVFVNYRRVDSSFAAFSIKNALDEAFGEDRVFMDVEGIETGSQWPDRLQEALGDSAAVVAVIGTNWLSVHDQNHRRRIDDPEDWVRREIEYAIGNDIPLLPVLVKGAQPLSEGGLPQALKDLPRYQALDIRFKYFENDVKTLFDAVESKAGLARVRSTIQLPRAARKKEDLEPLTQAEIEDQLERLASWQLVHKRTDRDGREIPELYREYVFKKFGDVMDFMQAAAGFIEFTDHHPRWENNWRHLKVYFTTWDIGSRISMLDIDAAHDFERLYAEFQSGS